MKCLIIDDDPLACDLVESYLQQIGGVDYCLKINDGATAFHLLATETFDVVFLDLHLPGIDGISLLKSLPSNCAVIIISADSNFGAQSYDFNVIDYLLKPIDFSRLAKAVGRLKSRLHEGAQLSSNEEDALFLKDSNTIHRIDLSKLQYIEAQGNYAAFIFSDAKPVMTLLTLQKLTSLLPSNFLRIHRSYIINLRKIRHIEGSRLHLQSIHLPIGKSYRQILQDRIQVINS
jgi:two-component system LytT family response regulator